MILKGQMPSDLPDGTEFESGGDLTIDGLDIVGTISSIKVVDGFLVVEAVFEDDPFA